MIEPIPVTLIKVSNKEQVKLLLKRDALWKNIIENEIDQYNPPMDTNSWYLVANENNEGIGLFILSEFAWNTYAYHGGIYKKYRKETAGRLLYVLQQFKQKYPQMQFVTTVPSSNKLALRLNRSIGMKDIHTIKNGCPTGDLVIFVEG